MKDSKPERRFHDRHVHLDRRKGDDDLIDHVIRGVRRDYPRPTSSDRPVRDRRKRD